MAEAELLPANHPSRPARYLGNPMRIQKRRKTPAMACAQMSILFGICAVYFAAVNAPQQCDTTDILCANRYFTNTYDEARHRFIEYSSRIYNAKTYHLPIDIPNPLNSETNETLYIDITVVNPNAKQSDHLLIHLSGINGVEGFAGSAIQCALLSEMAGDLEPKPSTVPQRPKVFEDEKPKKSKKTKIWRDTLTNRHRVEWKNVQEDGQQHADECNLNDFPTVMFVHALNPYGMAHGIRSNEHNVDLNRNLKSKEEWDSFGYHTDNDIDQFLNPQYHIQWIVEMMDRWFPLCRFFQLDWVMQYVWTYTVDWYLRTQLIGYYLLNYSEMDRNALFERYIVGQSHDPDGLQYVGNGEIVEESHRVFQEFLRTQFIENEWKSQFKKITLMDVHTADGKSGLDTIVVRNEGDLNTIQRLNNRFKSSKVYGDSRFSDATGMSYGYLDFVEELTTSGSDALAMMQYFGTYSRDYLLDAERIHAAYNKEYRSYLQRMDRDDSGQLYILELMGFMVEYTRGFVADAFYIKDLNWKKKVLQRGHDVFCALYRR